MNVRILGTGGADGIPSFFGETELSEYARANGGKDVRTRTGAVVDKVLKVDLGPDTYAQCAAQGIRARDWRSIFVTHSHFDHFDPGMLQYCLPPFVPVEARVPEVFGNKQVLEELARSFSSADMIPTALIRSFETVEVDGYRITPVAAYHKLDEDSVNLVIERDGSTLLYATDTGVYQQPTWDFLAGRRFNAVVIECTDGFNPSDYWGHLSCEEVLATVRQLREIGCLDASSKIITTHHADSGMATHAQLEDFFAPHGITVGYDGLEFEC